MQVAWAILLVVLLVLVFWYFTSPPAASAAGMGTSGSGAVPAMPGVAPAISASATAQGNLPGFVGANSWEQRLPSGARSVYKFIFQGANVLMSRAGYTAEGSAAGDPVGATVNWSQPRPDIVELSQGTTKIDIQKAGPKAITFGLAGAQGITLTAAS